MRDYRSLKLNSGGVLWPVMPPPPGCWPFWGNRRSAPPHTHAAACAGDSAFSRLEQAPVDKLNVHSTKKSTFSCHRPPRSYQTEEALTLPTAAVMASFIQCEGRRDGASAPFGWPKPTIHRTALLTPRARAAHYSVQPDLINICAARKM